MFTTSRFIKRSMHSKLMSGDLGGTANHALVCVLALLKRKSFYCHAQTLYDIIIVIPTAAHQIEN